MERGGHVHVSSGKRWTGCGRPWRRGASDDGLRSGRSSPSPSASLLANAAATLEMRVTSRCVISPFDIAATTLRQTSDTRAALGQIVKPEFFKMSSRRLPSMTSYPDPAQETTWSVCVCGLPYRVGGFRALARCYAKGGQNKCWAQMLTPTGHRFNAVFERVLGH